MGRFTGATPEEINRRIRREGGFNRETLAGARTLSWADSQHQSLDPNGTARTVTLPAQPKDGDYFEISNAGSGASITIEDSAASEVLVLGAGDCARVAYSGGSWASFSRSIVGSGSIVETAADPYTVSSSDGYVMLTGTAQTVDLPAGANHETGVLTVKDKAGSAFASPVTIAPNGVETIDGAASLSMDANYAAITLVFSGTEWSIT